VLGRSITSVFIGATVVWLGATFFYSLVVLPNLFIRLETSEAGKIAALLFPAYYWVGSVAGAVTLGAALALSRGSGLAWRAASLAIAVMLACQLYSTIVLHPRVAELRGNAAEAVAFQTLHKRSVRLNAVVLLGGAALIAASGILFEKR
jgi:hypothetical protein